jgi:nitrogen fixation protein
MNDPWHFNLTISSADPGGARSDADASAVTVPDAHLLFSGEYQRSGRDLVVSDADHRFVIPEYFRGEKRPTLVSPEGALLDGRVVDALTGQKAYAQASGVAVSVKVVGHVVRVTGSASVVRNGVTVEANDGDVVYQSDLVQTGSGSTLGLVLIDGTTFNLSANARLMLNDLTYDTTSNSNGLLTLVSNSSHALFTLVQGAAGFVAGQVAKTGDMQVATPVAVIGIRGTAVILDIDSVDGKVSISVADQHDGQVHSVQVFKCAPTGVQGVCTAGEPIGIVASDGAKLTLTPAANFEVIAQETSKTAAQSAQEFSTFQQVLTTYDIGKQLVPNTPPPSDGKRGDANPQSTPKFAGSPPPSPPETPTTTVFADVSGKVSGGSTPAVGTISPLSIDNGGSATVPSTKPLSTASDTAQTVIVPPLAPVAIANLGGLTNQAGQTITGTVDAAYAGATVTLLDTYNGVTTPLGTVTVGSGGVWSKAVMLAGEGAHSIVAQNAAADITTSTPVVFTLDTTPPSVAIASAGGSTSQASQTIIGTVDAADAGATVTVLDNNATVIGTAVVQADGRWSSSVTLTSGTNSLTARVTDAAGNTATSAAVIYTLNTSAPTVTESLMADTGASGSDHVTSNPALSGTGLANTVVHFMIDGSPSAAAVTSDAQGAWSFTPLGLTDGTHTIVVSQTDAFGNTGSASLSFTLDTTAPSVAIASGGGSTNQAAQTISGTGEAGTTVTLFDNGTPLQLPTVTVDQNGLWSVNITLSQGSNVLTARVTDSAGNAATSAPVIYTLGTNAPTVTEVLTFDTGASASDHVTSNPALSGTGLADTLVHLTIDGSPNAATVTSDAQGNWSFTPLGLTDGVHTIVANQTDAFGNTGSASLNFTLDTVAPSGGAPDLVAASDSGASNADNITTVTAPSFTVALGTGVAAGDTVELLLNGASLAHPVLHTITTNDVVAGSVALAVTASDLGTDGSKAIAARFSDLAGNSSTTAALTITLDTTAPSVAITSGGGSTNQATQTISGTGEAGTTVMLFDNGTQLQLPTINVDQNGLWSATVMLASGSNLLTAQALDLAGNLATSSPVTYTLSTNAPTVTESLVADTGASGSDHITSSPALSGTGLANTVVHFTIDGTPSAATTTANVQGVWSFAPLGLSDGSHTIVASQTDAFGNTGSASLSFTLDTTAPAVAITSPGGSVNQAVQTISGTGEAGTTVMLFDNGIPLQLGSVTVDQNGLWSATVTLANGSNQLTAQAADIAGNLGSSGPVTYTLSSNVPTVTESLVADTGASGSDHITSNPALSGTGLADTLVHLTIDGIPNAATVTSDAQGNWSFMPPGLSDGSHTIVASQTDAFGNTGSASLSFTLDTAAPAVAITTIEGGDNLINAAEAAGGIQISGTAEAGSTLMVNGAAVSLDGSGQWTTSVTPVGQGALLVTAVATDVAGNSSSTSTTLTLDTIAPSVAITSTGGSVNQAVQTISGTGEAGTTVMLFDNGSPLQLPTINVDQNGLWSATVTLASGSNLLTAQAADLAGNLGSSGPVTYTLSTNAPTVTEVLTFDTGASGSDHITSSPALSGTGVADTMVHFTIDGTPSAATVTSDAQGNWSFAPPGLADGVHTIVASQTDTFGNTGSASLSFTLDTTAPAVAITSTGGSVNQAVQTISGTGEAGTTVMLFDNGSPLQLPTINVDQNGLWSATVTLASGSNLLTAQAADLAGNLGSSGPVTYTLSTNAPTVTEVLTFDTGASGSDHITSSPALSGTGVADTMVHFTIDGTPSAATVTSDAQGNWSFAPPGLADGAHTIVASQTDTFGNTGSASLNFTLDTVAPSGGTPDLVAAFDSGTSSTDNITKATAPSFTVALGTGVAAGDTVELLLNGVSLAHPVPHTITAEEVAAGSVTLAVTAGDLGADGSKAIAAKFSDLAGNSSITGALTVTLDTTAPSVAITSSGGSTNQPVQTVSGTVDLADVGATVTILDGSNVVGTATVQSNGAWSGNITLSEGSNVLTAQVSDSAGNLGASNAVTFTLNTTVPTGGTPDLVAAFDSGVSNADNITNVTAPSFTVALGPGVASGDTVELLLNGASLAHPVLHTVTTNEVTAGSVTLAVTAGDLGTDGTKVIAAQFSDGFGNSSTSSALTITLDTTAPSVAITGTGGPTNQASQTITGTVDAVDAGATITILDNNATVIGTAVVQGDGSWSSPVTLSQGSNVLTARVTDLAGNTATSASVSYTLNSTAPTVTESLAADTGVSANDHITSSAALSGTGLANTVVHFTIDGTPSGATTTSDAQGNWSFTPPGLSDGSHTIVASQTDAFGNTGSASLSFTLDTTAPAVAITTIEGGDELINAAETAGGIQISGTAEAGSTLTVNGAAVSMDGAGHWTTSVTPAGQGGLLVTAVATDAAGNSSSTSTTLTVDSITPSGGTPDLLAASDSGASNTDNVTNATAPGFTVALSSAVAAGDTIELLLNGASLAHPVLHTVTAEEVVAGSVTLTVTAGDLGADGSKAIAAKFSDAAGNSSTTATLAITIDTTAPSVAITSGGGSTNQPVQTISGTVDLADVGATVTILDGSNVVGSAIVQSNGTWSGNITLSEGSNVLTARVGDVAGNLATSNTVIYTLNTTVPTGGTPDLVAAFDSGVSNADNITNVTAPSFTVALGPGVASGDTVELLLNGASLAHPVLHTVTTNEVTAGSVTLAVTAGDLGTDGTKVIAAQFSDGFGNSSISSALTITLDTTAPSGGTPDLVTASDSGVFSTDNVTNVTTPGFTVALGTGVVAGDIVELLLNGASLAHPVLHTVTANDVTAGSVTLAVTAGDLGADGNKAIAAKFSDAAGNVSTTAALTITLDTVAPTEALAITAIASVAGSTSLIVSGANGALGAGEKIQVSSDNGVSWTDVVQNTTTTWSMVDGATHPASFTYQARIIDIAGNIGTSTTQAFNGEDSTGIVVENLNPADGSNLTVNPSGNIEGVFDGVKALTYGAGNVGVTSTGANITGDRRYGIEASSSSTGSILVTTTANDVITSGSAGINAYNQAASIPQIGGVTTSSISVNAKGTINSGSTPTGSGARPAGILAGYKGGSTNTPNAAVFGNVIIDNSADISAAGGDGIRAYNYGAGNITVTDRSGSTIVANDMFGIGAVAYGSGKASITTEAGTLVESGATGIQAINLASAIAVGAASSVSVTAHGTVHSGVHLTPSGSQPQGISAGYFPGNVGASNTSVNGTVFIDNFASVTADAGWGIDAYNYGNGNVTLIDEANTDVFGAQYGIAAYSLSSGAGASGSVIINVGPGATITAGALYGLSGIVASVNHDGNISVTTSTDDVINSGGTGIQANVQTTTASSASLISIIAAGTINSGFNTNGNQPGGMWIGYSAASGAVVPGVHGSVLVDSSAIINAASGVGVGLYNFGTGSITAALEPASSITAVSAGVNAFAQGGGNLTIINQGTIAAPSGAGIIAGSGNGLSTTGNGIISITNSGAITSLGGTGTAVVQINNWSAQDATFANTGTVVANLFSASSQNLALGAYNGTINTNIGRIIVNNTGTISGNVTFGSASFTIAGARFNNNAGGTWNVHGSNWFGGSVNAINNAGIINLAGTSNLFAAGSLLVTNTGTINILPNGAASIYGDVAGTGTFAIGDRSGLELAGSVASGQTILFADGKGVLTLDSPAAFQGTISGFLVGDVINLLGGFVVSTASTDGSTLTVTDTVHNQTLSYSLSGVQSGTTVNVLSANAITLVPTNAVTISGLSTPYSDSGSAGKFYIFANDAIAGSGVGINIASSDSNPSDNIYVNINQTSSVSVSGIGVSVTTAGANISLLNAGSGISSTNGAGISTNSGTGSNDIIDFGNVSGGTAGISSRTSGAAPLSIVVGGNATVSGTTSHGIVAISTLGSVSVTTKPGTAVNSASAVGILVQNQGTSVPSSSISISSAGTITAGTNGIAASYLLGTSTPATIPDPPNTSVHGDISIDNAATITAINGSGIVANNYGIGNITISSNSGITAKTSSVTTAQYGIAAFSYNSGSITVATGNSSSISSGAAGINASNQATGVPQSAASTVTVVASGSIHSGATNNNSGSAPAGILAGFNPGTTGVFNAGVFGDVLVNDSANIIADAGDGINAYNYGVGDIAVNLGFNVSIQALTSAASAPFSAPYGVNAANYGPGTVAVTTASGDLIVSGSSGINAVNQATVIDATRGALIAVTTGTGTIHSGAILTNSGGQPSGISAGFLGGTSIASNLSVNGTVIVNNAANIIADAGYGINAYNYGNGDITVNAASGSFITSVLHGIDAHEEGIGGTGDIAVNVYSGVTITSTSTTTASYGVFASSVGTGKISVITSANSTISAGSSGINAVNLATAIPQSASSSIVVTAAGTINSGSHATGTGNAPAGILAGYLGGSSVPVTFPQPVYGDVIVNNSATINAAAGDGIRAYTFGIGNVTVNDFGATIVAPGGASPPNGVGNGIVASNNGTGDIHVTTAAATSITSGGSGIAALNRTMSNPSFPMPSSEVSVLAYGSIHSGSIPTSSGDPAAGILAGYDPNNNNIVDANVHGNVSIDDYASIFAAAGTDGIRGINYGTGDITVVAEAGALVSGGRYGIAAQSFNDGEVSVTNYGTVIGTTAAIDAISTSSATVAIDNFGHLIGNIIAYNATFINGPQAEWSLDGTNAFSGASALINAGAIDSNGVSAISGFSSFTNTGVIEVVSGSLELTGPLTGGGVAVIHGAILTFDLASDAQVRFAGSESGTLILSDVSDFTGSVAGFSYGDTIELKGVAPANVSISSSGSLHVNYGIGSFELIGNYDPAGFSIVSDNNGGTDIVWNHQAPQILMDQLSVVHNADGTTTVLGVHVSDTDPGASAETFAVTVTTGAAASGSSVVPSTSSGSLTTINNVFSSGVTYDPGSTPPLTDKVTVTVADSFGATDTLNFVFSQAATGPNIALQGTPGKDVILATNGPDVLTGGSGQDQFVFTPTSSGSSVQHTITDFVAGLDKLDVQQFSNISVSSIPQGTQQGSDTLITLDSHDTLLLKNVVASTLQTSDFIVHA